MSLKEIILYFFPFTTSEAYMALAPFIASALVLGAAGALGTLVTGRYVAGRVSKAYGRSVRSRKRRASDSRRSSAQVPTKYRSDDPRRISPRDVRMLILFILTLSILTGSVLGLSAAYLDISRRDPVSGLYQIQSVHAQPAGQGMIQVVHLYSQEKVTLFFRRSSSMEQPLERGRYRLEYLPRTRMLTHIEALTP